MLELKASENLVKACLARAADPDAVRAVSFLARATCDYTEAPALLSSWLVNLSERSEPRDRDAAETLTAAAGFLPEPGTALAPAAIKLIRRLLTCLPDERDLARRSRWQAELSRWLSQVRDHAGAVIAADEAAASHRKLTALRKTSREHWLAGLVLCLENLAERLRAQGNATRRHAVLSDAVTLASELASRKPGLYGPWLASLLMDVDAVTSTTAPAIGYAQDAVALYRQAAQAKPGMYEGHLGFALEVLSQRCQASHRLADALSAVSEASGIYEQLLADLREFYRPNLARALDNQGVLLARAGWLEEALETGQRAVSEYKQLQRTRPGQFDAGRAQALEHLGGVTSALRIAKPHPAHHPAMAAIENHGDSLIRPVVRDHALESARTGDADAPCADNLVADLDPGQVGSAADPHSADPDSPAGRGLA